MDKIGIVGRVKRGLWIIFFTCLLIFLGFGKTALAAGVIADAGPDQSVQDTEEVLLDGSQSEGGWFFWEQISGPSVTINNPDTKMPTFTAPEVTVEDPLPSPLVFQITAYQETYDPVTDQVTVYVYDSQRVAGHALYLGYPYGISVSPGTLIGFTVTDTAVISTSGPVTGIVPDVLNGAAFDTVISTTVTSTVTLFFDTPVPPGYDLWRLSRSQSQWLDLRDHSNFNSGRTAVSWTLADNNPLFDDNPVTGTINDPAAMARVSGGGSGGNGDGWCFIGTMTDDWGI
jgi:hypothetical protein